MHASRGPTPQASSTGATSGADVSRRRTPGRIVLKAFVALVFAASFGAKAIWMGTPKVSAPRGVPTRVISLAPSITEILFALSVGDRVVGVTRFCDHPPEVAKITKVGGYQDPSYEAIVGLRADLVILLPEHERPRTFLAELGIETLAIGNTTTEEILDSIVAVGRRMGAEAKAKRIVADVRRRLARVAERTRLLRPARVLVSIGRAMGSGSLKDVYVSGPGTLYDEAITLAGGKNACGVGGAKYPKLSAEGVLRLDPDVIIDLAADVKNGRVTEEAVIADWQSVPGARAVREGRVHIISEVYAVRPGPRFILLVEHLARILHPDVDWGRE